MAQVMMDTHQRINHLCNRYHLRQWMGVLPGWDWTWEHKDIVPDYRIEIAGPGFKQTISTQKPAVINEVAKINFR